MLSRQLLQLLRADNPWLVGEAGFPARHLPEPFVPRRLEPRADQKAALVVGPRQTGKSTLIWKILEDAPEPALYLNCEEPAIREWLRSPATFLADLEQLADEIAVLFFEEAQFMADAGLFLKGVVDRRSGKRIYVTGSSSFDLESKTRESLAGRARRYLLLPFSTLELAPTLGGRGAAVRRARLAEEAENMTVRGSYPAVIFAERPEEELAALVEAFIVRDVSDRFRIANTAAFRTVLRLAASQIGNLANISEWASLAGVSHATASQYIDLLEATHVLRLIPPFAGGKRAELTSRPKVFFLDNGVRNQLFGGYSPLDDRADRGALLENFVFTELYKVINPLLDGFHFWRSKSGAEVDFVIVHQGRLAAFEVKAGEARGRVSRSARSFIDAYRPELFVVVNRDLGESAERGETRIEFLTPIDVGRFVVERFLTR